jgi:translation initiation factor 6 (eIF-6)
VPRAELELLPKMINDLTSTNLFSNLTMKNHQGILDRHIVRQRNVLPTKSSKLKQIVVENMEQTIDAASNQIMEADDPTTVNRLFQSTR